MHQLYCQTLQLRSGYLGWSVVHDALHRSLACVLAWRTGTYGLCSQLYLSHQIPGTGREEHVDHLVHQLMLLHN